MTDWAADGRLQLLQPDPVRAPGAGRRGRPRRPAAADRRRRWATRCSMAPALALGILTILCRPAGAGRRRVRARPRAWSRPPRRSPRCTAGSAASCSASRSRAAYADTTGTNVVTRPVRWLRDKARWRDFGFLWFSATGGFVMSVLPVGLLVAPVVHLVGALVDGGALVVAAGPARRPAAARLVVRHARRWSAPGPWPSATSSAHSRVEQLERRVEAGRGLPHARRSTTAPPRYAGSSATCTTAPRPGSPRSA